MVQGSRLLLILPLLACKAESVGVTVPKGGPEAISQEDLSRDVWMLTQGVADRSPGGPSGEAVVRKVQDRLEQMHLLPAFGQSYTRPGGIVCGQRDGRDDRAVVVAAEDPGQGASGAAAVAMMISASKAFDRATAPTDTMIFCAWPAQGGRAAYAANPAFPLDHTNRVWIFGPVGPDLQELPGEPLGGAPVTEVGGTPASPDAMERLDFRALAERIRGLYPRLIAREPAP